MAIEPLSSVMTFQAQDVVIPKTQTVQPVDMEVSPDDQAANVDATTASVVRTQEEDKEAGKNSGNDSESAKGSEDKNSQQIKNSIMAHQVPFCMLWQTF